MDQGCVGTKFFEGLINVTFFKRIKKRLQETLEYYTQRSDELKKIDVDNIKIAFIAHCQRYVLLLTLIFTINTFDYHYLSFFYQ